MAELTVMGIDFKDMRPSLIAFMTMLNAIDRLDAEIQTALGFELFLKSLFGNLSLAISV